MKNLNWLVLNILLFAVPGECYRKPTLPDNCTCVTSEGIYSLFHLRRRDGKPSYNPCVPYDLTSRKGKCINVALCKYNKDDQPVYDDIGEQGDVKCDISNGKVALIYPIK
ncbi:uncharacterized protein LOC110062866 isoform X2 [Orbicella faveolata]|uniref:uncharacterized protein LOC110062866 isoform X2 n=1 Tax=Orbicella faveolata TaxID=48498 RepID=UPI0009E27E52|nr:uncharacterized protein LOC110062866 isoform X2 [Orbicella faveolata]